MFNIDVRNAIRQAGFRQYEVAEVLGISETSFSRSMARKELPSDKKQHILRMIEKMIERRNEHGI